MTEDQSCCGAAGGALQEPGDNGSGKNGDTWGKIKEMWQKVNN